MPNLHGMKPTHSGTGGELGVLRSAGMGDLRATWEWPACIGSGAGIGEEIWVLGAGGLGPPTVLVPCGGQASFWPPGLRMQWFLRGWWCGFGRGHASVGGTSVCTGVDVGEFWCWHAQAVLLGSAA